MLKRYFKGDFSAYSYFAGIVLATCLCVLSIFPNVIISGVYFPAISFSTFEVGMFFVCLICFFFPVTKRALGKGNNQFAAISAALALFAFTTWLSELIALCQAFTAAGLLSFLAYLIFTGSSITLCLGSTKKFINPFAVHCALVVCFLGTLLFFVSLLLSLIEFFTFTAFIATIFLPAVFGCAFFGLYNDLKRTEVALDPTPQKSQQN